MSRLWDKGDALDAGVHAFTVGEDWRLDSALVPYDLRATAAHARMLQGLGHLGTDELESLLAALAEAERLWRAGEWRIRPEDEDAHTRLEAWLTERCGDAGRKVHLGRSRNDQVLVALRLLLRERLGSVDAAAGRLEAALRELAARHWRTAMPGTTHTRPAMLSSFGLWSDAWARCVADDRLLLQALAPLLDRNPLGSAAGFGTGLGLDRRRTSELLGFAVTQVNPLHCALSRGRDEQRLLEACARLSDDCARMAADLIPWSGEPYGYCRLPDALTTGSSIMPQKRNPDVLELVRARSHAVWAETGRVRNVLVGLGAGYHRDYQETKAALMHGLETTLGVLEAMRAVVEALEVDEARCRAACGPELFAVEHAYRLATEEGLPFRDAYRRAADEWSEQLFDLDAELGRRDWAGGLGPDA
jgi:argininosuccinate lyase